ncbi:MAG TPA: CPBP family intramembrane glutamic endopeptidase [Thermoanaerobaculia bacterium]|nr:CPBP family intramembrane glutamic endopeptidase [Thermoanaerobaculia bacterium]
MPPPRSLIRAHPQLTYFALVFALSWGGVLWVVGPGGFPGAEEEFGRLLPLVVLAMLAGPSVAGVLMTGLVHGRAGLQELRARLLLWRVGARWWAVALLAAPLVVAGTLFALSLASQVFLPGIVTTEEPASHLLLGMVTGLAAGLFEELGWTGFAVPGLRRRFGVLATGLLVGLPWGAWHLLVTWWGSSSTLGALPLAVYLPALAFSFLPPYRVLMVWVYDRTGGSLLVAMAMHASLTASVRIFDPLAIAGLPLVTYNLVLGGVLWGVVGGIGLVRRGLGSPVQQD